MFLFNLADIVYIPFGWLLGVLYQFTDSYGWALILFSIIVKFVLLPTTIKSKRSMMKTSRLTPRIQEIQAKYEDDKEKQSQALQQLYKEEGVSMGGGCLWSLLPLLILIPLYNVVRDPITLIWRESGEVAKALQTAAGVPDGIYAQMMTAAKLHTLPESVFAGLNIKNLEVVKAGMNFSFLGGIDLAAEPQYNIFNKTLWSWDWPHIGAFLLPVLAAGMQLVSVLISQAINNSLITNEKGIADKEAAKNSQTAQSGKMMMYIMPIITLFIGFGMPAAMSLYWLIQGLVSTVMDNILTIKFRKEYDAEDALRLQKALEEELIAIEKERIRADRRAANPDGITDNTSKKKLQQKQQREQEAARAAAKKEYNAKRGIVEEEKEGPKPMSGIADRPFCKGRNYDPSRYASTAAEEEE